MDLINIMEVVAIAVTLLMFLTGISPSFHMYKTRDTRNVPFPSFLLSCLSCWGMFHYGCLIENTTLIFINSIGTFLQVLYTFIFLTVVKNKARYLFYTSMAAFYLFGLYYYMYINKYSDAQMADLIGPTSSAITVIIMTIPGLELVNNIRNKNTDGMPLIMLLGGLLCSSTWLILGLLLGDVNIYLPNIPGLAITLTKLFVIHLYSEPKKMHAE